MLKYTDTKIVFEEIPDEITLAINISNCPCHCKDCHSPYLAEDIGTELTDKELLSLIEKNEGITCVAIMGGDSDPVEVERLLTGYTSFMAFHFPDRKPVKTAWYSGRSEVPREVKNSGFINYIKLGPYVPEKGGLDNPNTNQVLYKIKNGIVEDITYKFWKNEDTK